MTNIPCIYDGETEHRWDEKTCPPIAHTCICGKDMSKEVNEFWQKEWQETFKLFHKNNPSLGSAGWNVSPQVVENFIKSLLIKV